MTARDAAARAAFLDRVLELRGLYAERGPRDGGDGRREVEEATRAMPRWLQRSVARDETGRLTQR